MLGIDSCVDLILTLIKPKNVCLLTRQDLD